MKFKRRVHSSTRYGREVHFTEVDDPRSSERPSEQQALKITAGGEGIWISGFSSGMRARELRTLIARLKDALKDHDQIRRGDF